MQTLIKREHSVQTGPLNRVSAGILLLLLPVLLRGQAARPVSMPVIDMHFHTVWGEPNRVNPSTRFAPVNTPEEMRRRNIAALDRNHVVKVVASGDPDQLPLYEQELGARLLPGMLFQPLQVEPESAATLRKRYKEGKLAVMAEFPPQYAGLEPASPKLESYWALAEELDIPVGIHMGLGGRGVTYRMFPEYRMRLSNPLLLEDVLVRHPKLRVYICHAGWPFINELLGLLWAHPQVYVDIAIINWAIPEAEFNTYLRRMVDAGFSDRIMYGSDNMTRPESIDIAVARTSAPFLSEDQKRDILCRNAARFLRLGDDVCRQ